MSFHLRVITWNVLRCGQTNARTITNLIEYSDTPDVIALQETNADQISHPDYDSYFAAHDTYNDQRPFTPASGKPFDGSALMIRKDLSSRLVATPQIIPLPDNRTAKNYRQRKALVAIFQEFGIATAHFCHHQIRNRFQVLTASQFLPDDRPAVILGDFNMVGPTLSLPNFQRVSPILPTFRLYPFSLDRIHARGIEHGSSKIIRHKHFDTSDHRPVQATLLLTTPSK